MHLESLRFISLSYGQVDGVGGGGGAILDTVKHTLFVVKSTIPDPLRLAELHILEPFLTVFKREYFTSI